MSVSFNGESVNEFSVKEGHHGIDVSNQNNYEHILSQFSRSPSRSMLRVQIMWCVHGQVPTHHCFHQNLKRHTNN